MSTARLSSARLSSARLSSARLSTARLSTARLSNISLSSTSLSSTSLRNACHALDKVVYCNQQTPYGVCCGLTARIYDEDFSLLTATN